MLERLEKLLNPRRSLRAWIGFTFGGLAILLTLIFGWLVEESARGRVNPELFGQFQRLIIAYGLALGGLFLILGWLIAGRITRPLSEIAEAARRITRGSGLEVIPTYAGHDEVASLSRSLNLLVAELNQKQRALLESQAELEARVADRTRQLTALHDVLSVGSAVEGDLSTVLANELALVLTATGTTVGGIHTLSEDGTCLELVTQTTMGPAVGALRNVAVDHPLFGDILDQQDYLVIADLSSDPRTEIFGGLINGRQLLGIAIRKGTRNLGVLTIVLVDDETLDQNEIQLLMALANELAIVIENAHLRRQAEALVVVEERNRLARELHDSVTQTLYSTTLLAEAGRRNAQAGKMEKAMANWAEAGEMSQQALKEMRLLVYRLRPSALEKVGLVPALEQRLKSVESRAGIAHELIVLGEPRLADDVEDSLFHMALEGLNNALRHSQATAVTVQLSQEDEWVQLLVRDNGRGFVVETALAGGGLGLTSLKERVAQLQGELELRSAPGEGTTVCVRVPSASYLPRERR